MVSFLIQVRGLDGALLLALSAHFICASACSGANEIRLRAVASLSGFEPE
jgi:hypothetical protein